MFMLRDGACSPRSGTRGHARLAIACCCLGGHAQACSPLLYVLWCESDTSPREGGEVGILVVGYARSGLTSVCRPTITSGFTPGVLGQSPVRTHPHLGASPPR